MSFGNYQQNARQNFKTGELEVLKTALQIENKKTGELMPIYKCYFEVGSQLYKIEISNRNKEHKSGKAGMWVKITKKQKRAASAQRF